MAQTGVWWTMNRNNEQRGKWMERGQIPMRHRVQYMKITSTVEGRIVRQGIHLQKYLQSGPRCAKSNQALSSEHCDDWEDFYSWPILIFEEPST